MGESKQSFDGVEILGQRFSYPKTLWGALSVSVVIGGICFCVFFVMVKADPRNLATVATWFGARITPGGKVERTRSTQQIQFWTPSVKTKMARSEDVDAWEKIDNDDKVVEFGDVLRKDPLITGFRRYEVSGTGLRGLKSGYWWVVGADQKYDLSTFIKTYRSFWQNDKAIYIEVLGEGGSQER